MNRYITCSLLLLFLVVSVVQAQPEISNRDGLVFLNGDTLAEGATLQEGATLNSRFGDTSHIDIMLSEGRKIRLQNAKAHLKSLRNQVKITLEMGKLFYASDSGVQDNLTVNTQNAIAGVRGTKFYLQAKEKQTYVCVCEGTVSAYKPGF
ncbi:MAG: FecR domain-containing protein, partial [bacterium]